MEDEELEAAPSDIESRSRHTHKVVAKRTMPSLPTEQGSNPAS